MSTTPRTTKVVPVGFCEITFDFLLVGDSDPFNCTLGAEIGTAPITPANALFIAEAFGNLWDEAGVFIADVVFTGVHIVSPTDGPGPVVVDATVSVPGGIAGGGLTQNTAMLIHKNTGFGGRRNKGRMYLPGVYDGNVDNAGNVQEAVIAAVDVDLALFIGALTDPGSNLDGPVLFHSYQWTGDVDPGPPPGFPPPTPVLTMTVDAMVATQRRRLRR